MYSFKDRLIDWANAKGAWTRIGLAVGITLLITAIILAAGMPSRGAVNVNAVDIGELKSTLGTISDELGTKASRADLDSWSQGLSNTLGNQAGDISALGSRMGNAETKLNDVEVDIIALNNSLSDVTSSPPEAYLTGTFGNYTLHVITSEAGNFTANVHLAYSRAFGYNGTYEDAQQYFYSGINWTQAALSYATIITFNGTAWELSEVWFNIGVFPMAANNETAIGIMCAGLDSTWEPSFAYAEVYPVLKE